MKYLKKCKKTRFFSFFFSEVTARLEQSIASLDTLIADVDKFIEEGKSHTEAPLIIDVILPFLCSYLPAWWHRGPGRLIVNYVIKFKILII
jgi:hypothetical protein